MQFNTAEVSTKRIIVVLGSGRSGTALLMQVLSALGMSISENMISADEQNPMGAYEDSEIYNLQTKLLRNSNLFHWFPLEEDWLNSTPGVKELRNELQGIVESRIGEAESIWGFKDPRTPLYLSMWTRIFNKLKVVPSYILTVRHPSSVVSSMKRQYDRSESQAELSWLNRNVDALRHTGVNCYIVHYEDWFTRSKEMAAELLAYTGLDAFFHGKSVSAALKGIIKENLNRAVYEDYEVQNEYVLKLYEVLKQCRGSDFDRAALMQAVTECRKAMLGFKGWYRPSQELQKMVLENNRLLMENKDFLDETENQKRQIRDLKSLIQNQKGLIQTRRDQIQDQKRQIQGLKGLIQIKNRGIEDLKGLIQTKNRLIDDQKSLIQIRNCCVEDQKSLIQEKNRSIQGQKAQIQEKNRQIQEKNRSIQENKRQAQKWKREAIVLRSSYSFRLGQIFLNGFGRSVKKTILTPYYLVELAWDIVTRRGREGIREEND